MTYFIDFETAPIPDSHVVVPEFTAPSNLRDPEKIKSAIAEKEAAWRDSKRLDPTTGFICAIGLAHGNTPPEIVMGDLESERDMLAKFWAKVSGHVVVGWSIHEFDIPYAIKRSWALQLKPPMHWLRPPPGRFWGSDIFDLRTFWTFSNRYGEGTLAEVAKFLGLGTKDDLGPVFWETLQEDPDKAEAYLRNDVELTRKLATILAPDLS